MLRRFADFPIDLKMERMMLTEDMHPNKGTGPKPTLLITRYCTTNPRAHPKPACHLPMHASLPLGCKAAPLGVDVHHKGGDAQRQQSSDEQPVVEVVIQCVKASSRGHARVLQVKDERLR